MLRIPLPMSLFRVFASAAAAAAFVTLPVGAQSGAPQGAPDRSHVDEVLRGLGRSHPFGQVAISPDGTRLAWIEGGRGGGEIVVAPVGDLAKVAHVTAAT